MILILIILLYRLTLYREIPVYTLLEITLCKNYIVHYTRVELRYYIVVRTVGTMADEPFIMILYRGYIGVIMVRIVVIHHTLRDYRGF